MNRSMSRLFLFFPLILVLACEAGNEKKPEDVLEEERFQKVLLDLYLLEGEASYRRANLGQIPDSVLAKGTAKTFEERDIDREGFERSYRYYMEDPERMKAIHEKVLNELMRRSGKEKEEE